MNHEARIKEQRTNEAMKNGYMGTQGKFALIAKRLGHPIYDQKGGMFQQRFMDDPFYIEEEGHIPTLEEDEQSYELGHMFDGLSRGVNLNIFLDDYHREIIVRYCGQVVYKEVAGELEGYVPNPDWENKITEFSNAATVIERKMRSFEREERVRLGNKKKQEVLDTLRNKWGFQ